LKADGSLAIREQRMDFRIADTFTDSLARLTGDEQKLAKTTAFDLQLNPANPGMQFHRLTKSRDPNFWSVRVGSDLRLIVHKTESSLMLCYVDHHDAAYAWAERRKIERHPQTGAAQLVEVRETVREIIVPKYVDVVTQAPPAKRLFTDTPEWVFLSYGVPPEWMDDVRAATEDTLFDVAEHLPREAAELLLNLATGAPLPPLGPDLPPHVDAFKHPDAQSRFRVIESREELERALEAPWEKWTVFLHPAQRQLVEREYSGPVRVSGSAGTGKTIVALHRAVQLARAHDDARVLLTTFSDTLANALRPRLRLLISNQPRIAERLEVHSMTSIGRRLYEVHIGRANIASESELRSMLGEAACAAGQHKFSSHFLWTEWTTIVDAWQLDSWEAYRDVKRLGRKTRLAEKQRLILWGIFDAVRAQVRERGLITVPAMFHRLATKIADLPRPTFDYVVIDEAQDVSVAELRLLAALGGGRANSLFFTGDLGQRIFQQPFSWKELGVDVRGRSSRLRVNYRTSHQIRLHADRLLGPALSDVDGVTEERRGTISVFNGVEPVVAVERSEEDERERIASWLRDRTGEGLRPHEMTIFVRSAAEVARAEAVARAADLPFVILNDRMDTKSGHLTIATMHLAKGLEFRAVVVMACDDEVLPLQERIDSVSDESDLEEVYQTERHLLYVACTRARDQLLVTAIAPGSEFLEDLRAQGAVVQ
jgi:superfamily I DNA/RNA helicase/mRNA-degrading endonuclease RelE of RelBE toxin-antitoxin system